MEDDRRRRLIAFADEKVPIEAACRIAYRAAGMADEDVSYSRKVHCPFGDIAHDDGGAKATFRVYASGNHAYCFEEKWFGTPVRIAARALDLPYAEAARRMLDEASVQLPGWRQRWTELHQPVPVDTGKLAAALQTWCGRFPGWEERQFDAVPAAAHAACLRSLSLVRTEDGAAEWLAVCKNVMATVMEDLLWLRISGPRRIRSLSCRDGS
jgi:hypothetical protein